MENFKLMDITKEEAREMAKLANVNLLVIMPIYEKGIEGFHISYKKILGKSTVSTKKILRVFSLTLSDVIHQNFYPY